MRKFLAALDFARPEAPCGSEEVTRATARRAIGRRGALLQRLPFTENDDVTKPPPPAGRLADSPWFWGLLFSLMSLVGIGLIGPKYAWRQAQIEGRFLGRERAAVERQRRAAGLDPVDLADTATDAEAAPSERIVPTWTLVTVAGLAAAGSAAMLWRERRARPLSR